MTLRPEVSVSLLLARVRAEAGGTFAALVGPDAGLVAHDASDEGAAALETARTQLAALVARAPWAADRVSLLDAHGGTLVFFLERHRLFLVADRAEGASIGHTRLLVFPLVPLLERAIDGGSDPEAGSGDAARRLH